MLEAMKMVHEIRADADATVLSVQILAGDMVDVDQQLPTLASHPQQFGKAADLDTKSPPADLGVGEDLQEVQTRHGHTLDNQRSEAVAKRHALYRSLVDQAYERGKAINMAMALEIDAVIDPADTRAWLAKGLAAARIGDQRSSPVDSW